MSSIPGLIQPPSRLGAILNSKGPLIIIIPGVSLITPSRALSIATRLAHDLDLYFKLDAEVISDSEAIERLDAGTIGESKGNIVFIGLTGEGEFAKRILSEGKTVFSIDTAAEKPSLKLNGDTVQGPSKGMQVQFSPKFRACTNVIPIFRCPVPTSPPNHPRSLHPIHVRNGYLRPRKDLPALPNPHRNISSIMARGWARSRQSRCSRRTWCRVRTTSLITFVLNIVIYSLTCSSNPFTTRSKLVTAV